MKERQKIYNFIRKFYAVEFVNGKYGLIIVKPLQQRSEIQRRDSRSKNIKKKILLLLLLISFIRFLISFRFVDLFIFTHPSSSLTAHTLNKTENTFPIPKSYHFIFIESYIKSHIARERKREINGRRLLLHRHRVISYIYISSEYRIPEEEFLEFEWFLGIWILEFERKKKRNAWWREGIREREWNIRWVTCCSYHSVIWFIVVAFSKDSSGVAVSEVSDIHTQQGDAKIDSWLECFNVKIKFRWIISFFYKKKI